MRLHKVFRLHLIEEIERERERKRERERERGEEKIYI